MISLDVVGAESWGWLNEHFVSRAAGRRTRNLTNATRRNTLARDRHAVSKKGGAISPTEGRREGAGNALMTHTYSHPTFSENPKESTNMHFRSAA